jgi:anti-sigma B factor antagonist
MTTSGFEPRIRREAGVAVIELNGDIDTFAEEALNRAYEQATQENRSSVLLNFEGTGYINSTGIALIVALLARARKERRRVLASGLSDHYREIFQITRLADFMAIYPDEATATAEAAATT